MSEPTPLRIELEARVLAMLNGELSEAEAHELEQILAHDPELAAYRDRMAALLNDMGEAQSLFSERKDDDVPQHLSSERRKAVFNAIAEHQSEDDDADQSRLRFYNPVRAKDWNWRGIFATAAALALLLALVSALLIPSVGHVKMKAKRTAEPELSAPFMQMDEVPRQSEVDRSDLAMVPRAAPPPPMLSSTPSEAPARGRNQPQSAVSSPSIDELALLDHSMPVVNERAQMAPGTGSSEKGKAANELGFDKRASGYSWIVEDESDFNLSGPSTDISRDFGGADSFAGERQSSSSSFAQSGEFGYSGGFANSDASGLRDNKPSDDSYVNANRVQDFASDELGAESKQTLMESRAMLLYGDVEGAEKKLEAFNSQHPGYAEAESLRRGAQALKKNHDWLDKDERTREQMLEEVSRSWQRPQVYASPVTDPVSGKLQSIHIPRVSFSGVPLSRVMETLSELSVEYDPALDDQRRGINLVHVGDHDPLVNITLRNLSLGQILDFTTESVGYHWKQDDGAVVVSRGVIAPGNQNPPEPKAEKITAEEPFSTFSLNVSDVSFRLAESALQANTLPAPGEIRAEEFINALQPEMPAATPEQDVQFDWELTEFPMAHNRQLLRLAVQALSTGRLPNQPANLVIVLDCSGSMQRPDRQAILQESLNALAGELGPRDRISAVVFARTPRIVADGVNGAASEDVVQRLLAQRPEGGTNLETALEQGYALAQRHLQPKGINRVVLLTDGAANLGEVNADALRELVIANRQQGIALDAFGIGWDGYNDELLEAITRNSDGHYAFLNSPETAAEDFAGKVAGALNLAAANVKVQIEWNPNRVISYRQIGYEKHQLKKEDFRDNTVDAAELTAAEAGQALYVVQLDPEAIGGLGTVRVRYLDPHLGEYQELAWPLEYPPTVASLENASPSHRLAAAGALLADKLAWAPTAGNYTLAEVNTLVSNLPPGYQRKDDVQRLRVMIERARQLTSD